MRHRTKRDRNHAEIVAALRKIGVWVIDLSAAGNGVPDLLCIRGARLDWLEIKDGTKPPSRRKLTPAQQTFHTLASSHTRPVRVVTSVDEALAVFARIPT